MGPQELLNYQLELRAAQAQFPGLDITLAYEKYKKARGEKPTYLTSRDQATREAALSRYTKKPCTNRQCLGTMHLEPICPSCVEGKGGWQSAWTCDRCFTRILSKKDFSEWFA